MGPDDLMGWAFDLYMIQLWCLQKKHIIQVHTRESNGGNRKFASIVMGNEPYKGMTPSTQGKTRIRPM